MSNFKKYLEQAETIAAYQKIPQYKKLIAKGFKDISSPVQMKHGTIMLQSPIGDKYSDKYSLHTNGYVRKYTVGKEGTLYQSVVQSRPLKKFSPIQSIKDYGPMFDLLLAHLQRIEKRLDTSI